MSSDTSEPKFKSWYESAAEARERLRQPVLFNGKTYFGIADAAKCCGYSPERLRAFVSPYRGEDCELTGQHGIKFIRKPRHKGDLAAPLYFDLDSLPRKRIED